MELLVISSLLAGIAIVLIIVALIITTRSRKKSEKQDAEIHFRDELFSVLANNTDDIYIVIASDGSTVEYVSPNIERILGVTPEEAKADLYSIQAPTYLDGTLPIKENLLSIPLGGSVKRESRRTNKLTGERICFEEPTYHMTIDGIDRFVAVLSDRTADRNQRSALEEALASAKAANEAKSTFLSNVSHDIRTPMNAIVGLSELLEKDAYDPDLIKQHAGNIKASSNHLLGLINDVLDMSKIESGSTTLHISEFRLQDIIEELDKVISAQADAKNQQFTVTIAEDVPSAFMGDKLRLIQVLMNILSNAVKYTPSGGTINFDVSCAHSRKNSGEVEDVRFVINDNGIGMSEQFMEHMFDPFIREKQSVINEIQGTGLGMPIAKSLVDLMGGSIKVDSERGKGSTFTVDIGLRVQTSDIVSKKPNALMDISGMHFLVVEDIEINAEVLSALLSMRNATCDIAENGKAAVEIFSEKPENTYDAILMDVQMPIMGGYEATRKIRSSGREDAASIPIIAMTANAFIEDVNEAFAAGMDAHLAKPTTINQLCETLSSVFMER